MILYSSRERNAKFDAVGRCERCAARVRHPRSNRPKPSGGRLDGSNKNSQARAPPPLFPSPRGVFFCFFGGGSDEPRAHALLLLLRRLGVATREAYPFPRVFVLSFFPRPAPQAERVWVLPADAPSETEIQALISALESGDGSERQPDLSYDEVVDLLFSP